MERVYLNDVIFTYQEYIPYNILRAMMYAPAEVYSGPSEASRMDLFAKIVNGFKLKLPIIFAKKSSVWRGAEYSSDQFKCKQLIKCFVIHD